MWRLPRPVPDRLHNKERHHAHPGSHGYDHIQHAHRHRTAPPFFTPGACSIAHNHTSTAATM